MQISLSRPPVVGLLLIVEVPDARDVSDVAVLLRPLDCLVLSLEGSQDVIGVYLNYVDGRPRYEGIRSFLAARDITLPEGSEHDPEGANTVHAIGERKTRLFRQALQKGIASADGAEAHLNKLRKLGIKTAVGSSSRNTTAILHAAGLDHHLDVCVDGLDAKTLRLPGKPDPAVYLEAARRLEVEPSHAILFEDALVGVEAGKRGGFKCVVGIDHDQQSTALARHGADIVIKSLRAVHVEN